MAKERILITVKTYPTLSRKYGETVCTAGITRGWFMGANLSGSLSVGWKTPSNTSKYDWIEVNLVRNQSDPRPETVSSGRLRGTNSGRSHGDGERLERATRTDLARPASYSERLEPLMGGAKKNTLSLAVFKPTKIRGFNWEEEERKWNEAKVAEMRKRADQKGLFAEEACAQMIRAVSKLPV